MTNPDEMTDDEFRRAMGKLTAEEKLRLQVGAMGDREYEQWERVTLAKEAAKATVREANKVTEPDDDPEETARINQMSNREFEIYVRDELGVSNDGFGALATPDSLSDRSYEISKARQKAKDDE